ncbi:MAG TPA: helix-turn-helix domain-containing protein [Nitrospiraceae bacterium]|nr:helix-turn-helix domain-containing protein [Nitrospiraceae bacterium]
MEKALVRVDEAAAFLSVSRWTIYRWVDEGRLRATKIGKGSLRIFHESIVGLVYESQVDRNSAMSGAKRCAH